MPLTEERTRQIWPQQPNYDGNGAPVTYPNQDTLLQRAMEGLAQELHAQREAQAVQREALRRLCNIDEGDLLAMEKAIIAESRQPQAITPEAVQTTIQQAIEANNETIRGWFEEMATWIKRQAPAPAPADPMDPDYTPPAPPEDPPDTIEHLEEPAEEAPAPKNTNRPDPTRKMREKKH